MWYHNRGYLSGCLGPFLYYYFGISFIGFFIFFLYIIYQAIKHPYSAPWEIIISVVIVVALLVFLNYAMSPRRRG